MIGTIVVAALSAIVVGAAGWLVWAVWTNGHPYLRRRD